MGDVLAYEAELLGLVKEVRFLSLFLFFSPSLFVVVVEIILARQDSSVFALRARLCN